MGARHRSMNSRDRRRLEARRQGAVATVPNPVLARDVDRLNALTKLKLERVRLEVEIRREVRAARRAGATWAKVGEALGVSLQAAQDRYGPYPVTKKREVKKSLQAAPH